MASSANTTKRSGIRELDRKLETVSNKIARKAVRSGQNAGLKVLTKSIRSEIGASSASPQLKRALKRTVGKKFGKAKGGRSRGRVESKAGLGVGKNKKAVKRSGKSKGGVGISTANVHWFALGTTSRVVYSTGRPAGQIDAIPAVRRAYSGSKKQAVEETKRQTQRKLDEEFRKLARS